MSSLQQICNSSTDQLHNKEVGTVANWNIKKNGNLHFIYLTGLICWSMLIVKHAKTVREGFNKTKKRLLSTFCG